MSLPVPSTTTTRAASASSNMAGLDPKQLQAMEAPLIALTNQCGGDLRRLLFAFFSFLYRRTDFYCIPADEAAKIGFKEGDAEKLLLAAFRQFPLRKIPSKPSTATTSATSTQSSAQAKTAPKKAPEPTTKNVSANDVTNKKETQTDNGKNESTTSNGAADKGNNDDNDGNNVSSDKPSKEKIKEKSNNDTVQLTEEGLQVPVGNGGSTKRYKWTQTIQECSVLIGVPQNIRGKDLSVAINATSIAVKTKQPLPGESTPHVFVEGPLVHKIRADESTWSLEGGVVVLTLDKVQKTFWKTVIQGDDEIDTDLVDSRTHIGDYDESTQAQIRKIIFDQNQQRQGLPTSDEITGKNPEIPPLPPGVEYIDKKTLDENVPSKTKK